MLAAALFSGCTSSPAQTAGASSPVPTETATVTPIDADAAFRTVADASCARATAEGVVERSSDGVMFLVPDGQAYEDYSAAFDTESDGSGVIWSTEVFFACAPSIGYQMSEEGSAEYPLEVSFDAATGSYRTILDVDDYGRLENEYSLAAGVFATVEWLTPEDSGSTSITYGPPSSELVEILHREVDIFLADQ